MSGVHCILRGVQPAPVSLAALTDASAANRVHETSGQRVLHWDQGARITVGDQWGWRMEESGLIGSEGKRLPRLPTHRAFWFG